MTATHWCLLILLLSIVCLLGIEQGAAAEPKESALVKSATFYASFDEGLKADFGGGELTLSTRFNHPTEQGQFVFQKGVDDKAFRIARTRGKHGGCLEAVEVLPRNGRIFFPARGNLAYRPDGWGGSLSVWINTDPDTLFRTKFCDPIQITQKGANNGGIWFDFNDAKPRDLRMGVFPAVATGQQPIKEEDAQAPMVWVKRVGFKNGDWHHVVLTWQDLDTGKKDAVAVLYIDGKRMGEVKDRDLAMKWEIDKVGIYVAVNYIGLLDELALFNKPLTPEEVGLLRSKPGLLTGLKRK